MGEKGYKGGTGQVASTVELQQVKLEKRVQWVSGGENRVGKVKHMFWLQHVLTDGR